MTPGPSFILIAQTAMAKSRSESLAVALGLGVGAMIFAFLASIGLVTIFKAVPELFVTFKVAGGCYLCFLALKIWRSGEQVTPSNEFVKQKSNALWKMFIYGLTTQLCNPKTAIVFSRVFAALLPSEVPEKAPWF